MSVLTKLEELIKTLEGAKEDAEKVDKGNKAARTRVRNALQTVRTGALDLRKDIAALNKK